MASVVLSLLILALIVLMVLRMGLLPDTPGGPGSRLVAVRLSSSDSEKAKAKARTVSHASTPVTHAVQPSPPTAPVQVPPAMILLSKDEFAASDISRLPKHAAEADSDSSSSNSSQAAYGPGEGPGGARLYRAEWYRRPTGAETQPYFPDGLQPGAWADIACRTVEHYHVEDCQELGESPPGSGFARGLRRAAWQFLVRPPRKDGVPMIGAWVSIHYEIVARGSASDDSR